MYFDDLKIGMNLEIKDVIIKEEEMIDFSLKYDNVPLHKDKEYAKNTPFKKLIAPVTLPSPIPEISVSPILLDSS